MLNKRLEIIILSLNKYIVAPIKKQLSKDNNLKQTSSVKILNRIKLVNKYDIDKKVKKDEINIIRYLFL